MTVIEESITSPSSTESTVRAMSKADRRAYLRARGWEQLGSRGSECWTHPERPHAHATLAAAVRIAVAAEQPTQPLKGTTRPMTSPPTTSPETTARTLLTDSWQDPGTIRHRWPGDRAHVDWALDHLVREGEAERDGNGWVRLTGHTSLGRACQTYDTDRLLRLVASINAIHHHVDSLEDETGIAMADIHRAVSWAAKHVTSQLTSRARQEASDRAEAEISARMGLIRS